MSHLTECSICLEKYSDERKPVILKPCNHKCFCNICIDILSQNSLNCPLCRTVVEGYYIDTDLAKTVNTSGFSILSNLKLNY